MRNYKIEYFHKNEADQENINISTIYVSATNMYHALNKGKVQVCQEHPKSFMVVTKIELESEPSHAMEGETEEVIETNLESLGAHLFA